MEMLFDSVRRAVDPRTAPPGPYVVQWDFSDAEPWHLRVDNGSSAAAPGRAAEIDLEVRCRYEDWVDIVAGRLDPRKAVATGRLRPRGNARALWRVRGLFGAS
jgi:putative sterol carrier protein